MCTTPKFTKSQSQPPSYQTYYRRHYYTTQISFEQSLDVYKPHIVDGDGDDDVVTNEADGKSLLAARRPLVVLVVGSAWMGHRSIIYTGTSWWNSSGPETLAKLGFTCVAIRHRGAFPRLPPAPTFFGCFLLPISAWTLLQYSYQVAGQVTCIWILIWILLTLGGHGAASFDDMLQDVTDALHWVHQNALKNNHRPVVFGGYSSGGHVAATLLQRPDLFRARQLPPPEHFIDAALFISGVLATRPVKGTTDVNNNNNNSSNNNNKWDDDEDTTSSATIPSSSTWFIDIVTYAAFGKQGKQSLPSPLEGIHRSPRLPHLFIGCRDEVFGIRWMDLFFCSKAYADHLEQRGVPAKFIQVESNHWNILGSNALKHALHKELGSRGVLLLNGGARQHDKKMTTACIVCQEKRGTTST